MQTINAEELEITGNLELLARQVVEGFITGLHKSPFHGFSVEFAEHRLYNTGESTRHIDWKLFARSEKLFVKRYEEETNLRCTLVLDTSGSMYFPEKGWNKMKFSILSAACIMNLMRRQRDAFGLTFIDETIRFHSDTKSSQSHYLAMLHELERLLLQAKHESTTSLSDNLNILAEKIHRRSLVIIFSDMMQTAEDREALFNSLQHLKFNKHEVVIFHVQDKKLEESFEYSNRPYLFIDAETGEKVKLQPADVKENYLKAMHDFKMELKSRCAQFRIDLVEADSNLPFDQVLIPFLIKRSKLY